MQTTQKISIDQLRSLVEGAFAQGEVIFKESYSKYDAPIKKFSTPSEVLEDMPSAKQLNTFLYSLYYPDAKGYIYEKRISLNPEKCDGHKFRYSVEGWGWINFQCDFRNYPIIECTVSVNSPERAAKWYATYPEYKNPDLWDWGVIKTKAGKFVSLLRKYEKIAELSSIQPTSAPPVG